jgi:hypothetical protein
MGDLTTEHTNELLALRDAQAIAAPTQPLDSTTLFVAEQKRVRNLDASAANQDSNTKLEIAWDGAR